MDSLRTKGLQEAAFESALMHGAIRAFDLNNLNREAVGRLAQDDGREYALLGHFAVGERLRRNSLILSTDVPQDFNLRSQKAKLNGALQAFRYKNLEYSGFPTEIADDACFAAAPEYTENRSLFYAGVRIVEYGNRTKKEIVYSSRFEDVVINQVKRAVKISRNIHRIPKRKVNRILHPSPRTASQLTLAAAQVLLPSSVEESEARVEIRH